MAHELDRLIEAKADRDPGYAIAYALIQLAGATQSLSTQVKYLGNGDASTSMGAIEAFGMHLGEKIDSLSSVISESIESLGK